MLSIIVVSHNHNNDIIVMLDSLKNLKVKFQLVLVDNTGSLLNILDTIKSKVDDLVYVKNVLNRSFSQNNNIGVSLSKYDKILILNPDTYFPECNGISVEYLLGINNNTIVFPMLFNFDNSIQESGKRKPSILLSFVRLIQATLHIKLVSNSGDYWYLAAAMFINKSDYYLIGGFDERFPLFAEDAEICDRARKKNITIKYDKNITIYHKLHNLSRTKYIKRAIISNIYLHFKMIYNSIEALK